MLVDFGSEGTKDVLDPEVPQQVHIDFHFLLLPHGLFDNDSLIDGWECGLVEDGGLIDGLIASDVVLDGRQIEADTEVLRSVDDVDVSLHVVPAGLAQVSQVLGLASVLDVGEDLLQVLGNDVLVVGVPITL